jgi:steroid 5-alpha reductase family enzyme
MYSCLLQWSKGYIPLACCACGIAIETIADYQKNSFKSDPKNKEKFCNVGLWKLARHPNYFGELLTWWSLFAAAVPALRSYQVVAGAISPLTITGLLLFVSGVPLLEASYQKRYGDNPYYKKYVEETNAFVPLPLKLFWWFYVTFPGIGSIYNKTHIFPFHTIQRLIEICKRNDHEL